MALQGIRVIEIAGLAPVPFCGMLLSDFGASVIRVDRPGPLSPLSPNILARGKRSIAINLKDQQGQGIVKKLVSNADVLIEPFRPGIMEKLNLGPDVLMAENPRLIYARLSGYGQSGPFRNKAGHDINYIAMSGVLSRLGRKGQNPTAPINLIADFAGGGLTCAVGILMSLLERTRSGKGQVVDSSMTEGSAYISSFIFNTQHLPIWSGPRGHNWLDTGAHFYDTYETKDGKYMAVGSIEPQFYSQLMKGLGIKDEEIPPHFDPDEFDSGKKRIQEIFRTKTRAEWTSIFEELDACVTPVLELEEAPLHPLNKERNSFIEGEPLPAPKLSRTPAVVQDCRDPQVGEHSVEVMKEIGFTRDEINEFMENGVVEAMNTSKL